MGMNGLAEDGIIQTESIKLDKYDSNYDKITENTSSEGCLRRNRPGTSKDVSFYQFNILFSRTKDSKKNTRILPIHFRC